LILQHSCARIETRVYFQKIAEYIGSQADQSSITQAGK